VNDQTTAQKPVVVLDKSFAQGTRKELLQELAEQYIIVVTSSFYYEAFTKLSDSRAKIFAGFPEFRRVNTPELYRLERSSRAPALSIDTPARTVNPRLASGELDLADSHRRAIDDFESNMVHPQIDFWKEVIQYGVVSFEDADVKSVLGNTTGFRAVCAKVLDANRIRNIATEFGLPFGTELDERWITFRGIQASLLHGLTLRFQYPNPGNRRKDVDLEHDVHDIDYLTLGLHAGCFATNESSDDYRKLGWKFKFLCPQGHLLQSVVRDGVTRILVK